MQQWVREIQQHGKTSSRGRANLFCSFAGKNKRKAIPAMQSGDNLSKKLGAHQTWIRFGFASQSGVHLLEGGAIQLWEGEAASGLPQCFFRPSATVSRIGLLESRVRRRCRGGLPPPWLTSLGWLPPPPKLHVTKLAAIKLNFEFPYFRVMPWVGSHANKHSYKRRDHPCKVRANSRIPGTEPPT